MAQHTVVHEIPDALVKRAQTAGISLQQILLWIKTYGPMAIQFLGELLNILAPAPAAK